MKNSLQAAKDELFNCSKGLETEEFEELEN